MRDCGRWTQLRGAALALESEIWRFRTRTGAYEGGGGSWLSSITEDGSKGAEQALAMHIEQLTQHVMKSAAMGE